MMTPEPKQEDDPCDDWSRTPLPKKGDDKPKYLT